jgi:hypothetical protein
MNPRVGRPKSENPLSEYAKMRLTAQEKAALDESADEDGVTISEFMRQRTIPEVMRRHKRRRHRSTPDT